MASVGTVATVGPVPTGLVVSNQRCRTCMCFKSNQTPLFRRNLSLKVMKLADIKLREDDGLPTTICLDCEIDLERCYGFIAQIQNSDKKLRETLRIPHEIKVQEEPLIVEQQRNCNEPVFDPLAPEAINQYEIKQECIHIESVMDQESYNSNGNQNEHYFESHVEVLEDRLRVENSELAGNYDGQEEPLIEDQQRHCNDRVPDPLNYVKVEADTMNIEPSHIPETPMPGPSTQSPAVTRKVPEVSFPVQPEIFISSQQQTEYNVGYVHNKSVYILSQYNYASGEQNCIPLQGKYKSTLLDLGSSVVAPKIDRVTKLGICINQEESILQNILKAKMPPKKHNHNETNRKKKTAPTSDIFSSDNNKTFCIACNHEFGSVEVLNIHKEESQFVCRVCTNEFTSHDELENHMINHKSYECNTCKKFFFGLKDLYQHKRSSKVCSVTIECEICSKLFSTKKTLKTHKIKFHSNDGNGRSCTCVVCGKDLRNPYRLNQHLSRTHVVFEYCECRYCNRLCLGLSNLTRHIKDVHLELIDDIPSVCSTCGKIFKTRTMLLSHELTHDKTPMLCDICGKSIKGKTAMYSHIRSVHSSEPQTCDCCNKTFQTIRKLNNHLWRRKKQNDPSLISWLYCESCGKKFKSLTLLKVHRRVHSGEKPFKCVECGAVFSQGSSLILHKRVHSSENKYHCEVCGNTFRWKQTFDKHVKKCELKKENEVLNKE